MPWNHQSQASKHTKKANTPKLRRQWLHVARSAAERGLDEQHQIMEANAVVRDNPHRKARENGYGRKA
jgi:hypothetical protein